MEPVSVGRIVHVMLRIWHGGAEQLVCRAAIVTAVVDRNAGLISATVFEQFSERHLEFVAYDGGTTRQHDTWHWPERLVAAGNAVTG